ncbi:MAG TPA: LptF/LptG family permease [Candidatus Cloacimonadota bacterium]|nr:LptF/LptG family permease [Candidatus Cloacimonadota bacterium]HOV16918.1 LptF/LptG family permease [Candidatus Cloacimonadota bacterium]HQL14164.1 LptF/LptG family permease [Candidatus Cloacimonadota bacterium]
MVLKRYILKEHIAPFFLSLFVVTFVLMIDKMIDFMNTIITKRLDFGTVMQVFGLSLPYMLALSVPMAVLVATILAFGRMAVDREIAAMKASGINIYSLIGPLLGVALLLTGLMTYFNHVTLPETNHKLKNLTLKIAYYKPMTIIKAGEFTNIADYTIYVQKNLETELLGIVIYDRKETRFPRTIYAKSGQIKQWDNGNSLQVTLHNGEMHERDEQNAGQYQVRAFKDFTLYIRNLGNQMDFAETDYRSDREMTYAEIQAAIKDKQREIAQKTALVEQYNRRLNILKLNSSSLNNQMETRRLNAMLKMEQDRLAELHNDLDSIKVEYHKKFALAFAIIIFVLIGIPLGLMTRSSGIGAAFSVSSLIFLVYYIALTGGEQMADRGYISPFLSMWFSNIIFLILAIGLIIASIYERKLIDLHALVWKIEHKRKKNTPLPDEVLH